MPIKFNSIKKYGLSPFMCSYTPVPAEGEDPLPERKFISNSNWLLPLAAFKDVPLDIEVKTIRGMERNLPKITHSNPSMKDANPGYSLFVKTGIILQSKKGVSPAHVRVFEQDTIGISPKDRQYITMDEKFVEFFELENLWKPDMASRLFALEFCYQGHFGVVMPTSNIIRDEGIITSGQAITEFFFPGLLDAYADAQVKSATVDVRELESYAKDKCDSLQKEIAELKIELTAKNNHIETLKAVKSSQVSEEHVKSWPRPMFPELDKANTMVNAPKDRGEQISSISNILAHVRPIMPMDREVFIAYYLDHSNQILDSVIESAGTQDQTAVYPREIIRQCLKKAATGIIVTHNHPTGAIRPSQADRDITRALGEAAKSCDLRLLDHVIVGSEGVGYFSFRENGLIR